MIFRQKKVELRDKRLKIRVSQGLESINQNTLIASRSSVSLDCNILGAIFVPEAEMVNSEAYANLMESKLLPRLSKTHPEAHAINRTQKWVQGYVAYYKK